MFTKQNYLFALLAVTISMFNVQLIAQDNADDDVEEVIVTGSKIAKDEFASSSPITIINQEDILAGGMLVLMNT